MNSDIHTQAALARKCGTQFYTQGKFKNAIEAFQTVIALKPRDADAYYNLGNALYQAGERLPEAIQSFQKAIELNPNDAEAYYNLGNAFYQLGGKLTQSIQSFQKAIELKPLFPDAYNNLAAALKDQGRVKEAIQCYETAIKLKPDFDSAHSNLLLISNCHPAYSPEIVLEKHRDWAEKYAVQFAICTPNHSNKRDLNRRLRIGYISADFRDHPIAYFIEPILTSHNQTDFEIFCYSNNLRDDNVTERLKKSVSHWRMLHQLTDAEAAFQVQNDAIDILVDLSGHTVRNRLLIFARKPAPIQISYLGYPTTTGLKCIDYRISDQFADPPGMTESHYVEQLIRLPECTWCYQPPVITPEISPLPALTSGRITFTSFNHFTKISDPTVSLWSQVLKTLPNARLMILISGGNQGNEHIYKLFEKHGANQNQLELVDRRSKNEYYKLYQKGDISLDPFPCNGGTTTCDSLWMGVPVITLAGKTFASRAGVTLLSNLHLEELIAETWDQYVQIAKNLADNLEYLSRLRSELRERMLVSPLMDAQRFTHNLESAYRNVWKKWCEEQNR